jgi:hypothetical protein
MLRLKQCERALADGRLDEAFDLVRQPDIRSHRRGQDLTSELVTALVHRGRGHLAQGRLTAAAMDADKAVQLGGNLPDTVQLKAAVHTAQTGQARVNQQAGQVIALARRHADQGQLTIGQQLLAESPVADPRLDDFKKDLAARRAGMESSLAKATDAFNSGDWQGAIADHGAAEAMPHVESGRLDAAAALSERLDRLPAETAAARRLRTILNQCSIASAAIADGRQLEAEESLRRLQLMSPGAKWIGQLVDQARQWREVQTAMRTSPLSLLAHSARTNDAPPAARHAQPPDRAPGMPGPRMPSLVLHVDGVGSYLILMGSAVSIGAHGASRTLDLPLMIDASSPTIALSRSDEDYFLKSDRPVSVNDVSCVSKLLNSGDRIGLGTRCRLTFRRPSAASGTAVLDISGARLPTAAIRQVILMDREIVIGPGASAHIRSDDLSAPVVLVRNDDGLACPNAADVTIDGRRTANGATLPTGVPISVGSLGLVIAREVTP